MRPITRRLTAAAVAVYALLAPSVAGATSTTKQIKAATKSGVGYLKSLQLEEGAFETDWVLGALAAAGTAAADVRTSESAPDARSYYRSLLGDTTTWPGGSEPSVSEFERGALNAYAAGIDPARVSPEQNLIAQIIARYQPAHPGFFGAPTSLTGTVFGVLALADTSMHAKTPRVPAALLSKSVAVIRANQHNDGGWTYERVEGEAGKLAEPSEPDETGAAIAALCGAGVPASDPAIVKARDYLEGDVVAATGAFESPFGSNTDSTAWAIQGLDACGIPVQGAGFRSSQGKTPIDFLISQQLAGGGFVYEAGEAEANEYSSQDAVRALAGAGFTAPAPKPRSGPRYEAEGAFQPGSDSLLSLIIDSGSSTPAVCAVQIAPSAATTTLAAVLEAARSAATPAGCVASFEPASGKGALTQLNGNPEPPAASWELSIDGGKEKLAKLSSKIAIGDTLYLHLG